MAHTLFISDLHLEPGRPDIGEGLISLCRSDLAHRADAIYILGDLVEFWIGDDTPTEGVDQPLDALAALGERVPLYFQHGNRDFLVGEDFARRCHLQLLDQEVVIDLYGQKTLLVHGDTLCTDDSDYQQFRQMVRNPEWQAEFLAKSLDERLAVVREIRSQTREATRMKASEIMDVNADSVMEAMKRYEVHHLIHGHTHRPGQHDFDLDGDRATRTVLSDWDTRGNYLIATPDQQSLQYFDWEGTEIPAPPN
ncbi:MAG: UDP-2,3-diacylglucosamine diphosphatase [Pseudomonadota bacterium]